MNRNPGCLPSLLSFFRIRPRAKEPQEELPYRLRDDFLSPAEASFYRVLNQMVGEKMLIFPKVGLGDVFYVARPNVNQAFRNRIDRKHVDFLICRADSLAPYLAIELDDSSHKRTRQAERDAFVDEVYQAAGLPLVHVKASTSYDTRQLAEAFRAAISARVSPGPAAKMPPDVQPVPDAEAPLCSKCGVPMVLRVAKTGQHKGEAFFGCPNFPKCREVSPVMYRTEMA
jgi:hypothetical protein